MADNVVIRTIQIRGTEEGLDELTSKLKENAAAQKGVALVADDLTKRQISLAAAWNATGLKLNEQARSLDIYNRLVKQSSDFLKQGGIDAQMHADRVAALTQKYDQAGVAAQRMITGMSGLRVATAEAAAASKPFDKLTAGMTAAGDVSAAASQKIVTGMTAAGAASEMAIRRMMSDMSVLKQTVQETANATTKSMSQMVAGMTAAGDFNAAASQKMIGGLTRAADVSTAANQRLIAGMSGIKQVAVEAGASKPFDQLATGMTAAGNTGAVASQKMVAGMSAMGKEAAIVAPQVNKITESQAALTKQSSRNAAEMLNLGRQFADVAVSMQAGQSILTVGLQQGAQIIDVFASSGRTAGQIFSSAIGWAKGFATSTAGVVTGIGAIVVGVGYMRSAWAEAQTEVNRVLLTTGRNSGATLADINKIATSVAATTRLSVGEARELATALAGTGKIGVEQIESLTKHGADFAKMLGVDLPEANKLLAASFADPAKGVDMLNEKIGGFDLNTRTAIKSLAAQFRFDEARAALSAGLIPTLKQVGEVTSTLGKIWDGTTKLMKDALAGLNTAIDTLAGNTGTVAERLAKTQAEVAAIQDRINQRSGRAPTAIDTELARELDLAKQRASELKSVLDSMSAKGISEVRDKAIELANAFDPAEVKLKELREQVSALNRAMSDPGVIAGMSGEQFEQASRVRDGLQQQLDIIDKQRNAYQGVSAEVSQILVKMDEQQQLVEANGELARMEVQYQQTINAELEKKRTLTDATAIAEKQRAIAQTEIDKSVTQQVGALGRQLMVAQAVGQMAQIEAQHKARIGELTNSIGAADATRIANAERAVQLAEIESQHQVTMVALRGQLNVASQVTGIGQINAQYEATVASLEKQIGLERAIEQAEMGRAIALAEVNKEAERMLHSLQQEGELIRASSDAERDRIKARQTYQNLVDKGVDSTKAQEVASKQLANAEEARSKAEIEAADNALKHINTASDAWAAYESGVISWSLANDAANKIIHDTAGRLNDAAAAANRYAAALDRAYDYVRRFGELGSMTFGTHAFIFPGGNYQMGQNLFETSGGRLTQFDPAGYKLSSGMSAVPAGMDTLEYQVNQLLQGTDPRSAFYSLLGGGLGGSNASVSTAIGADGRSTITGGDTGQIDSAKIAMLDRLIQLMPKEQQAQAYSAQLQKVQEAPESLARSELIKTLTDKIAELTQSTDELNQTQQAMTDVLSPYYSTDPRETHLGFRAFAGGGIMTQYGELPLKQYQGGGMATSPQVAVFGEGSTPEAYVPVPTGRIPVTIQQPANSNVRPVSLTVNINAPMNRDDVKKTAFQFQQAARRAIG